MYRCLHGKNVLVPISRTKRPVGILDVGTGSGRWAIEVADEFENATVTAMDLSPVDPVYEIPENCEFIVGDLTQGLSFHDASLDLVHSRYLPFTAVKLKTENNNGGSPETSMDTLFQGSVPCSQTWDWMGSIHGISR